MDKIRKNCLFFSSLDITLKFIPEGNIFFSIAYVVVWSSLSSSAYASKQFSWNVSWQLLLALWRLTISFFLYLKKCVLHKNERNKKNSRRKTKSIKWWKKKERNVMNMIMMKRLCVVDAGRLVSLAQILRVAF